MSDKSTDKTRQEKLAKLPKWAQEEIRRLESNVSYFKEKFRSLGTKVPTRVTSHELTEEPVFLPDLASYTFKLSTDEEFKKDPTRRFEGVEVQVRKIDGDWTLRVQGYSQISIHPQASNLIDIKVSRR